jgi:hypothetical protein
VTADGGGEDDEEDAKDEVKVEKNTAARPLDLLVLCACCLSCSRATVLGRLALSAISLFEPVSMVVEKARLVRLDLGAGSGLVSIGDGLTSSAFPCRPVNPLLMIWLDRAREALQRAQDS